MGRKIKVKTKWEWKKSKKWGIKKATTDKAQKHVLVGGHREK
jgi:hypothetical protein